MSAGRASFAPTTASFGSQPSDAYFLLDNPPGPVRIEGALDVLGPLSATGPTLLGSGAGTRSLSTTGDAAFNGGITVGSAAPGSNQIVGYNGSSVTSVNIPFGLTSFAPGAVTNAGNCFGVNNAGILTNLGNVITGGGIPSVVIPLGQYFLYAARQNTAGDGGVTFTIPAPYNAFIDGYAVGNPQNGQNVLVEVATVATGQLRMVAVSPTGTPAGAGVGIFVVALLRLS